MFSRPPQSGGIEAGKRGGVKRKMPKKIECILRIFYAATTGRFR
jgi:hypothetical protein